MVALLSRDAMLLVGVDKPGRGLSRWGRPDGYSISRGNIAFTLRLAANQHRQAVYSTITLKEA